ncbi:MAG: hypothetical protein LBI70_01660 [Rickettsiales bacterium]|nr:hypothetical protein [Rickettsiales bacterium]
MKMKQFEEVKGIYDGILKNINGYGASFVEKQQKISNKYEKDLIYGEVPLELLYALFVLEPTKSYLAGRKIFYDLGSGVGNILIGSYLIGNFEKYIGIELLDSLYNLSLEARKNLCAIDKKAENSLFFKHGNILDFNIGDGDVLFFCCPNREQKIMQEMEKKFLDTKRGALIFSLIHAFEDDRNFNMLDSSMVKTTWGQAPLRVYERV